MPEQNKPYLDRVLMVETLEKLTQQLALLEEDPNIQSTKALVATQTELSNLSNEVTAMKQMIQALSDRTEHMIPQPAPLETLAEATKKMIQKYPISWNSVDVMDRQTLCLLLALLGYSTSGPDRKKQARLRTALDLQQTCWPDEELEIPAAPAE